jgi:hypothetical protein
MKSNHSARRIVRMRIMLLFLALMMVMVIEFALGGVLVARFGQATALRTDVVQTPNVSLGDVFAAIP